MVLVLVLAMLRLAAWTAEFDVGDSIEVYWDEEEGWFKGTIEKSQG